MLAEKEERRQKGDWNWQRLNALQAQLNMWMIRKETMWRQKAKAKGFKLKYRCYHND